ncbi:tripartite tricarboxylate transporter TctB family protein [Agrobacterium vitis]|uniref:Tripartite tricarboxylate transporter TctB family protein n=1 Tax=Agrobacterium vitis TaxID=373 RepID=A0AAE4WGW3_AGRVI|nr:tripartite tricarboxylate transporter TctB family protein [Agrobacterium vitis]MCF1501809.1 tripartite tricarboxylate transporter TctB family protein [Allorhizobium sp. Av2]MCM2443311.1 tripartite tricarboxylate transporter TctB family protein [Agrobacterium vitis]MUZ60927.1 tripartite tricarboxylate transporter TctB family protein [Agrobacterium vitis]MVA69215.1 tripartite tricarboxylate transporter TctB family protein [Agrobacterium vitis]MVA90228.1 tripartite tricarboxylate transporter T
MTETETKRRRDIYAGGIFIAIAALFLLQGTAYEFGTAFQMGPGFFPVVLAGVLAIFGVITFIGGFRKAPEPAEGPVSWRALVLVCLALGIFGAGARVIGLVPVVLICTFMTAMASRKNSFIAAAVMSAVMAALCFVIFKVGLAVALPTFGPAFGR